jgi:hypothetical protein
MIAGNIFIIFHSIILKKTINGKLTMEANDRKNRLNGISAAFFRTRQDRHNKNAAFLFNTVAIDL